jgi:hypothetical protein
MIRLLGLLPSWIWLAVAAAALSGAGVWHLSALHDARTDGLSITNMSNVEFRRLNISWFNNGMYLNAALGLKIDTCTFTYNNIGTVVDATTGQQLPNAIQFDNCEWNANVTQALVANISGAVNRFESPRVEQNGVQGAAGNGGMFFNVNGTNGAAVLCFNSGYFEGNAGTGADVSVTNTTATTVTVVFKNCTFNRVSSSRFVTQNLLFNNSGGGAMRVLLIGCKFDSLGSYVPSAARPFITYDGATEIINIGSAFSEPTSLASAIGLNAPSGAATMCGQATAAGGYVFVPQGISHTRVSAGVYTIAINTALKFGAQTTSYTASAVANDAAGLKVERVVKLTDSTFQVFTTNTAGVATDAAFTWFVYRMA